MNVLARRRSSQDLSDAEAEAGRREWRRIGRKTAWDWYRVCLLVLLPLLVAMIAWSSVAPACGGWNHGRSQQAKNLAVAKMLGLSCKLYAGDHEGAFPSHFAALVPQYYPADRVEDIPTARVGEDGRRSPFVYMPGLTDASPPRIPLVMGEGDGRGKYVVVCVDQSGEVCGQKEFREYLARYEAWRKTDAKRKGSS